MSIKIQKYKIIYLLIILLFSIQFSCRAQSKDEYLKFMRSRKEMDSRIDFYGRVLDDHGEPVAFADVIFYIHRFTPNPEQSFEAVIKKSLKTDKFGYFILKNETGNALHIDEIYKIGFERTKYWKNILSSYHYDRILHRPYMPDYNNPVVFIIRKKGKETFLVKQEFHGFKFKKNEQEFERGYDMIAGIGIEKKYLGTSYGKTVGDKHLVCDLRAEAILDPRTGGWTLVLSPGDADGGILVSDKLLYEAPENGYLSNYIIYPKSFIDKYKLTNNNYDELGSLVDGIFIYLRSRNPPLYSRIKIDRFFADQNEIFFGANGSFTNPYGSRNLEEATNLPGDVSIQLREEIRRAFSRGGNRPKEPDLPTLVHQWENNRPLSEKLKNMFKP